MYSSLYSSLLSLLNGLGVLLLFGFFVLDHHILTGPIIGMYVSFRSFEFLKSVGESLNQTALII